MDSYMAALFQETMSGIPITAWQKFLKVFSEGQTEDAIQRELSRIATEQAKQAPLPTELIEAIKVLITEVLESLKNRQ